MNKNSIAAFCVLSILLFGAYNSIYQSKADVSCKELTAMGPAASSYLELLDKNATKQQVELIRNVIADNVHDIYLTDSPRKKAFELIDKKGLTTRFTGEAIAMTRAFCFINPDKSMKGIAIDNFNYILDAVAKKMNNNIVSK